MICEIFNEKTLKEHSVLYKKEYIDNLVNVLRCIYDGKTKEDMLKIFTEIFNNCELKPTLLKRKIKNAYDTDISNECVSKIKHYYKIIIYNLSISEERLTEKYNELLKKEVVDYNYLISISLCKFFYNDSYAPYTCISVLFDIIKNYQCYYRNLSENIIELNKDYDLIEIKKFDILNNYYNYLKEIKVERIVDLKKCKTDILIGIFSPEINNIISNFNNLKNNIAEYALDIIVNIYTRLKANQVTIINERYNYFSKQNTLEYIGEKLGLTRERVRQLESKLINNIINNKKLIELGKIIYSKLKRKEYDYICFSELVNLILDIESVNIILLFFENSNSSITYDRESGILYNKEEIEIEKIIEKTEDGLGNYINTEQYDRLNDFERYVINKSYKKQNDLYVNKYYRNTKVYIERINYLFPNGFRPNNKKDYELFISDIRSLFGSETDIPNPHTLEAMITRYDFILCDKGTYRLYENDKLSFELKRMIMDYIKVNEPIVAYDKIYENFKMELNKVSIDNKYFLKGYIDRCLPDKYSKTRDFIKLKEENNNIVEIVVSQMKSYELSFSMDDLKQKFPGIPENTLATYAYNEIKSGLIWLGNKEYIYFDKINITEDIIKEIDEYIESLFIIMQTKILTVSKIYAKLSFSKRNLISKLNIKLNKTSLNYILQNIFKEKYYFNRGMISKEEIKDIDRYTLIREYAYTHNEITASLINEYTQSMNMAPLYSYLEFIDDISDDYVQINIDKLVNKRIINISEEVIETIRRILKMYFTNNEMLKTTTFNRYGLLPKLNYPWNKYLLVGIIRSFLLEEYEVENTTTLYNTTEFNIRKRG